MLFHSVERSAYRRTLNSGLVPQSANALYMITDDVPLGANLLRAYSAFSLQNGGFKESAAPHELCYWL